MNGNGTLLNSIDIVHFSPCPVTSEKATVVPEAACAAVASAIEARAALANCLKGCVLAIKCPYMNKKMLLRPILLNNSFQRVNCQFPLQPPFSVLPNPSTNNKSAAP